MNLYFSIFTKLMLFLPIFAFSQTSIGPLIGYDIASINVGEEKIPFGPPQTNGYENGSFLFGSKLLQKINNNITVCFRSGYTEKKIGEPKVWSNYLSYHLIQNSIEIERKIYPRFYLGTGFSHHFISGFNYNLLDQSKRENHIGVVMSISNQFKGFALELRYKLLWNLNQGRYEHIQSSKSLELSAGYMFELRKKR